MKKFLSVILSVVLVLSSFSVMFTFETGAVNPTPTNLITNGDFETDTGFTQDTITNRFPSPLYVSPAWALTDAAFHKWFRASTGNATIYSNIITDPANANNKIARVMQTALQGVTVSAGKTYLLTYSAKGDYAFQLNAFLGDMTNSGTNSVHPTSFPITAASGTKTYVNSSGATVVENISPYYAASTSIQSTIDTDKWATYKVLITLGTSLTPTSQVTALRFAASNYSSTAGDPKNVPYYLDDVSLVEYTSPNLMGNGDLSDVSGFQTSGTNFSLGGLKGSFSGTGSSVAVGEATGLPSGVKANTNAVNFTLDSSTTTSSATMYTDKDHTYTLKENTNYQASVWIKTRNLYGFKFFVYEPTYTDRLNVANKTSENPFEGQNIYSFTYISTTTPATRVARTDISYTYRANDAVTESTGTGNASMCILRGTATDTEIANGTAIPANPSNPTDLNSALFDPSKKFDKDNAKNGWVKVTINFKTKSGTWTKTAIGSDATDLPYAVPVSVGFSTSNQAIKAGNISTLSVASLAINELNEVSVSVPDSNKGGTVSLNGTSGLNVTTQVSTGDPINLVATPFSGNSFLGWFDSTGTTLISSGTTYSTTCTGNVAYIAKFTSASGNLFNNPGFEGYAANTVLSQGAGTKSTDGWSSGTASWMTNTVVSTPVYSGSRSLKIFNNYNDGAFYTFTVEPNYNYKVNLKWNMPVDSTAAPSTLAYAKVTDTAGTLLGGTTSSMKGTGNWEDVTFSFNSGTNTTVRLCLRPDGSPVTATLYVDEIIIMKTLAATITTSTTGASTVEGGAAWASKTSYSNGDSITFTAKAYPGNTFTGWFKNGVLYNSNLSFTEVETDNVAYEARFVCVKPNMVSDAGFESQSLGAFFNVANPNATPPITANNPNWTGSAVWGVGTIVNTVAADGTKSLRIAQRHNTSTRHVTGLKANTDYQFTFMYYFTGKVQYTPVVNGVPGTPTYNTFSYAAVTSLNYTYLTTSTGGIGAVGTTANGIVLAKTKDYDTTSTVYGSWAPITLNFNTGALTAVDLQIRYASDDPSGESSVLYIDDMSVVELTGGPTAPTATYEGYTAGTWTKNDVTFTLSGATYTDGIAKYQYSTDGTNWTDITGTNGTVTKVGNNVTQVLFPVTGSQDKTYSFRAVTTDDRSTSATTGVNVKIDKVVPVIGVSTGTYTAGTWTKNDVTFTLSNTATNVSSVTYKYSTNGTTWNTVTGSTFTVSTDTNASYQFKAVSGAGVESAESSTTSVKIQKTVPQNAVVAVNPSSANGSNGFYITIPTITLTAPTVTTTAPVTTYYKLWVGDNEPQNSTVFTGSNSPVISTDGNYTLKVWVVDAAGNASEVITKMINVKLVMPGDMNGDKIVDLLDVTLLCRYIAGWENITIITDALDINGDGVVDLKDVTNLRRYVTGWAVTIH